VFLTPLEASPEPRRELHRELVCSVPFGNFYINSNSVWTPLTLGPCGPQVAVLKEMLETMAADGSCDHRTAKPKEA
jgi:hypothetical protein